MPAQRQILGISLLTVAVRDHHKQLRAAARTHGIHSASRCSPSPYVTTTNNCAPLPAHTASTCRDALVFATDLGGPVDPRNALRTIALAASKAGMGAIGLHTLRHSAAVAWLEARVHIKAVADLLGHSSISITGDIYGHTSDDAERAAVERSSGALGL